MGTVLNRASSVPRADVGQKLFSVVPQFTLSMLISRYFTPQKRGSGKQTIIASLYRPTTKMLTVFSFLKVWAHTARPLAFAELGICGRHFICTMRAF